MASDCTTPRMCAAVGSPAAPRCQSRVDRGSSIVCLFVCVRCEQTAVATCSFARLGLTRIFSAWKVIIYAAALPRSAIGAHWAEIRNSLPAAFSVDKLAQFSGPVRLDCSRFPLQNQQVPIGLSRAAGPVVATVKSQPQNVSTLGRP